MVIACLQTDLKVLGVTLPPASFFHLWEWCFTFISSAHLAVFKMGTRLYAVDRSCQSV